MSLVIVNTRVANLSSVKFAFERLGVNPTVSADPEVIRNAERVVLPGVGTAPAAMRSLLELGLLETIQQLTQPVLGICLGMQILCESSAEGSSQGSAPPCVANSAQSDSSHKTRPSGGVASASSEGKAPPCVADSDENTQCLNLIPAQVCKIKNREHLPLPHMGWNQTQVSNHPLFKGLNDPWFYFVHSFAVPVTEPVTGSVAEAGSITIAEAEYTQRFSAAIANNNFMGVQFHPERSGKDGAKVLSNFLEISF